MLFGNKKPRKYSEEWLTTISDDELRTERECVRQKKALSECEPWLDRLLNRFDNEIIRRMNERYDKEHPDAKPIYREHGWYLPNDD